MTEFKDNLWAPWRMEYIVSLAEDGTAGCFICRYRDEPQEDAAHHVLWRTRESIVLMNRFPYTNGHLLIAPLAERADLDDLTDAELTDLWRQTRDAKRLLDRAIGPQGYNIGVNIGPCAGAGLPGHVHVHVVPRWSGDTNFMAVLGDVRVVPEALQRMYERLRRVAAEHGFPRNDGRAVP